MSGLPAKRLAIRPWEVIRIGAAWRISNPFLAFRTGRISLPRPRRLMTTWDLRQGGME
jgi:hypothetical protein